MYRSYLISALRSILKDRLNTTINLIGLSVGLACTILIYLYVDNELSYDDFHVNGRNIYRVYTSDRDSNNDKNAFKSVTSSLLGPTMARSLPEVESSVRMTTSSCKMSIEGKTFNENISLFDSVFFDIFTFKVLKGSLFNVLDEPTNLVLSELVAAKYFGDNDPVGEQLRIRIGGLHQLYTVKAIIENPPANSSIQYSMIAPYVNCSGFAPEEILLLLGKHMFFLILRLVLQ